MDKTFEYQEQTLEQIAHQLSDVIGGMERGDHFCKDFTATQDGVDVIVMINGDKLREDSFDDPGMYDFSVIMAEAQGLDGRIKISKPDYRDIKYYMN